MLKITRDRTIKFLLIVEILIMAFVELDSAGGVPIPIFNIDIHKLVVGFLFCAIAVLFLFVLYPCRNGDLTVVFLLAKVLLDLIVYYINREELVLGNYLYSTIIFLSMPLVYFIFKSYTGQIKHIVDLLSVYGLILAIQTAAVVLINGYNITSVEYKTYLRIPMGYSNIIAATLLTIIMLRLMFFKSSKGPQKIVDIILILGLFLTNSKGAMLLLFVWWIFVITRIWREKKNHVMIVFLYMSLFLFAMIFLLSEGLQRLLFDTTLSELDLNSFSSGRFMLAELAITQWMQNFWFGVGLSVTSYDLGTEVISTGVHNILLDIGVQSGLFGVLLWGSATCFALSPNSKTNSTKAFRFAAIVMLVYSMFEVTYMNYPSMFLLWALLGVSKSRACLE